MATKNRILLYGATGYMGRLLAEAGAASGLPIVLAGRNPEKLAELARTHRLPFRVITLETPEERQARLDKESRTPLVAAQPNPRAPRRTATLLDDRRATRDSRNAALDRALTDVKVVVNAAGPFAATAMGLARACVRTRTHYTDIGGEYDVMNELNDLGEDARKVGSVIMPGVGLTVMASDVLARYAVRLGRDRGMRQPHVVRVALSRVPFVSRGSARTMLASVRDGVRLIRNGEYRHVPVGSLVRAFNFDLREEVELDDPRPQDGRLCTAMTLADLLTIGDTAQREWDPEAWKNKPSYTPNVETYVEASGLERLAYELGAEFALALRSRPVKGILDKALSLWPEGPEPEERDESGQLVAVEVEDRYRRAVEMRLETRNSYDFTVHAALTVARCLLVRSKEVEEAKENQGFQSPAWASDAETLLRGMGHSHIVFRGFARGSS